MRKKITKHITRIIAITLVVTLFLSIVIPVLAQVHEPTGAFTIDSITVYRHAIEQNDQLYVITGTIEYTTNPATNVSNTFITRLKTAGGVELSNTTFYPFHDDGYDYGVCAIYFSAADVAAIPVGWNQPYTVHFEGNPTWQWLDTTAVHAMTGAVADDGGVLTDETAASNDAVANDMTLLPAVPAVNDAYYFGSAGMFDILTVNIGTQGNWTGTGTWEYWDGDSWAVPNGLVDNTLDFEAGTGNYDVTYTCPDDWQQTTVNGVNLYWLRYRVATYTAVVQNPLGTQSWTNTLDNPPAIQSSTIDWVDEGSVTDAQQRITTDMTSLAYTIESDWGGAPGLIEVVAGQDVLTPAGEDYFENSIPNIRVICPDLFSDVVTTPDFDEDMIITDYLMGSDDVDYDVYGAANIYAQTYTPNQSYSIDGVWIKAYRVGAPGNLVMSLRATLAGLPTGADLITGTIDTNTFATTATGEWYWVTFTGDYAVTAGTVYAIVATAAAGNVNNHVAWRADNGNGYANGQACFFNGAIWAAVANNDFMFCVTATNAYAMTYREQLANRLVGTRFDMTNLGSAFNLSRMWTSTIVWFIMCAPVAWAICRENNSYKPLLLIIAILSPLGALAGFIYLEVALLIAFFFALAAIFSVAWRPAP